MSEVRRYTENGGPESDMGKVISSIERQAFDAAVPESEDMPEGDGIDEEADVIPMGTASLANIVTGRVPKPTKEELTAAKGNPELDEMPDTAKRAEKEPEGREKPDAAKKAVEKLRAELTAATKTEKTFAEPCIEYLIKRCEESQSLAEDVCQQHKTWKKCYGYIFSKAKTYLGGSSGPVRSDTVFEWAEDYYHLDDRTQEEKKAKEAKEAAGRQKKAVERQKQEARKTTKATAKPQKPEAKAPTPKEEKPAAPKPEAPKKKSKKNELEGQMDLFSMLGM